MAAFDPAVGSAPEEDPSLRVDEEERPDLRTGGKRDGMTG